MKYPKIQTVFKRDPETKYKGLLLGQYSLPEFEYLKDSIWEFTEKIDGTNIRVAYTDGPAAWLHEVQLAGRTDKAQIPKFLVTKLKELFSIDKLMDADLPSLTLYGEGYGNKIQKVGSDYISDGVDFCLFDVRVGDYWLSSQDVSDVAQKLSIKRAPIIGYGTLGELVEECSTNFRSLLAENFLAAEGVVARTYIELLDRHGQRIITKIKYLDLENTNFK